MKSLSHIYLGSLYITLAVLEGVARADQWHSAPGSRGLASETLRPPASTSTPEAIQYIHLGSRHVADV